MYKAIQVTKSGEFTAVTKRLVDPCPDRVRIRVEACGVCHPDSGTVEGMFPIDWPRVPGHEVVGRIDAVGSGVQGWAVSQLGAHHYIDSAAVGQVTALQELGGAQVILITASSGKTGSDTFKGLRPGGVSIVVGVGPEPIENSGVDVIFGSRKLEGALTGNPGTADATFRFSKPRKRTQR